VSKNGKRLRLSLKLPWVATTDDLGLETLRGTFRIRGETETLAR
jgi:hypothetical protein